MACATGPSLSVTFSDGPVSGTAVAGPLGGADELCVGGHRVPCAPDTLAVGVTRLRITGEGIERPAVDGLLLETVGAMESDKTLGGHALHIILGQRGDNRPLRETGPVQADFIGHAVSFLNR